MKVIISFMMVLPVCVLTALSQARNAVWRESIGLYEDAVQKSPGKARPHYNLGRLYRGAGRDAVALKEYETAALLDPSDPVTHYNIGNVYLVSGRPGDAIREYQIALALQPVYPDARHNRDVANRMLADRAARTGVSSPERKDAAADAAAHLNQGNLHFLRGEFDRASEEYRLAAQIMPALAGARYNLGKVYRLQGKQDKALNEFMAASQLNPDDPETRYTLGNVYFSLSRFADAVREYRAALKLKPEYSDARYNLVVAEKALQEGK